MPPDSDSAVNSCSFKDFGFSVALIHQIKAAGYRSAFPIQQQVIPAALDGRDVLGRAPTGSGKTLAFGLPVLARLVGGDLPRFSTPGRPRSILLAPTRELAEQISTVLDPLGSGLGLRTLLLVGGTNVRSDIRALARPADVVVATPGRMLDLMRRGALSLADCRLAVVDEADHLSDLGFLPQVSEILDATAEDCQYFLFSATLDADTDKLVSRFLNDPVRINVDDAPRAVNLQKTGDQGGFPHKVRHLLVTVKNADQRRDVVGALARNNPRTLFFARTTHSVGRWGKYLAAGKIRCATLHGNRGHQSRKTALADFSAGNVSSLIATDVAARGIDIDDVELVVHIDMPDDHKSLVHRSGRTGRAGKTGTIISITFNDQLAAAKTMFKQAGLSFTVISASEASRKKITRKN